VGVGEAELARLSVHLRDEARNRASCGDGERRRGIVRARYERADHEIAHRDALSRSKIERRLTDPGRGRWHRHGLVEREPLERDERGHQLRDARHRPGRVRIARREGVPVDRALDDVRARLDDGCCGVCDRGQGERGDRDGKTPASHGASG
jgi:hypothetical protein